MMDPQWLYPLPSLCAREQLSSPFPAGQRRGIALPSIREKQRHAGQEEMEQGFFDQAHYSGPFHVLVRGLSVTVMKAANAA